MQKVEGKKTSRVTPGQAQPEVQVSRSDSVTITARSQEVRKAKELYEKLPEMREELVRELKEKVDSGTYKVASKDMADRIIYRAIVDKTL